MQANFDRLFERFEQMNTGSVARKSARSSRSPSRGGHRVCCESMCGTQIPTPVHGQCGFTCAPHSNRGGSGQHDADPICYTSCCSDECGFDSGTFSVAFVNASTHKLHLDRLLELNTSAVVMAETRPKLMQRTTVTSAEALSGSESAPAQKGPPKQ
eukprot:5365608-Amphidinium_carterae.1